jgi:hypothetical protein
LHFRERGERPLAFDERLVHLALTKRDLGTKMACLHPTQR